MNKSEIDEHLMLKKQYLSYPKLPSFLNPELSKQDKKKYKGLCVPSKKEGALGNYEESLIRGFLKRVRNWQKDHKGYQEVAL
jgi:hypothetical protein